MRALCELAQFCVHSPYNSLCIYVSAYVVSNVCAPIRTQAISFATGNYLHLQVLWLADYPAKMDEALKCNSLIGAHFYWLFISRECIRGERGLIALESTLGWILAAPMYDCPTPLSTEANRADTYVLALTSAERREESALEQQFARFWSLESIGISKIDLSL